MNKQGPPEVRVRGVRKGAEGDGNNRSGHIRYSGPMFQIADGLMQLVN